MSDDKDPQLKWRSLVQGIEAAMSPVLGGFAGGMLGLLVARQLHWPDTFLILAGVLLGFLIGLKKIMRWLDENK